MLRLEYDNLDNEDEVVRNVLTEHEQEDFLWWHQVITKKHEAIYMIDTSVNTIITIKKELDQQIHYKSLELFEYRAWD